MAAKLTPPNHNGSLKTWNVNLSFNITIALVITVLAILAIAAYAYFTQIRDVLVFAVAIAGGSAAIYGGFYASRTLSVNVERQKQQNAFEFVRDLYRVDTSRALLIIRKKFGPHVSAEDQNKIITDDPELHRSVLNVLGVFEDAAIAIQADMACEKILYTSLGFVAPWFFNSLKPYIQHLRHTNSDNTLYLETKWKSCRKAGATKNQLLMVKYLRINFYLHRNDWHEK